MHCYVLSFKNYTYKDNAMNFSERISNHIANNAGGISALFMGVVVLGGVIVAFSAGADNENPVTTPSQGAAEYTQPEIK